MSDTPETSVHEATNIAVSQEDREFLQWAYIGDLTGIRRWLKAGANVNCIHEQTGLSALHIAVGTNNLALTRYLIEEADAVIGPDKSGRWPTIIAAECEVDEVLSDYILEREANISGV